MKEKLIIKNFGPIKDMSFEFRKMNILVGEQGTGKSTVGKLIAAINKMASGETLAAGSGLIRNDEYGRLEHFTRHLKVYEIDGYLNDLTSIEYQHTLFRFEYLNTDCRIIKTKTTSGLEVPLDYLSTTFVPADRIAVNLLSNELLYSLNEINQDLPGYFVRFGQLFNRLKKNQDHFDFSDTLGVIYKHDNGQDKIKIENDKLINISDASSAVQANVPFLVVLKHQSTTDGYPEFYSADLNVSIIEEPELNCFPALQNSILKYIVMCIHPTQNDFLRRTIITTHSPYILTSLNNLIYAYQVGQEHTEEVNKIIEKKYWVNPNDVSAYRLMIDGTAKNILDEELKQIDAGELDGISRSINEIWDRIANIEYSTSDEN